MRTASTVFRKARGEESAAAARTSRKCNAEESLELVVCNAALPPMWPVAARVSPLFDHSSIERAVICIDVHDSLTKQTLEIDSLLDQAANVGRKDR